MLRRCRPTVDRRGLLTLSNVLDFFVSADGHRRVSWVMAGLLERVVVLGVVTADQRPPRVGRCVAIGTVQKIAVKEERISWVHLTIDFFEHFFGFLYALKVCPCLFTDQIVVYTAQEMGLSEDLHTTIFMGGRINGDHDTGKEGKKHIVLIPVSISKFLATST